MTRLLLCLVAFVLLTGSAFAQKANVDEPPLPKPIQKLRDEGAQLRYLGRDLGYDGWIAVQDGQEQYFYVTPDQSAFFLGVLFNKNGRAITFDQMKRLQGKNDPILADLENAPSQRTEAAPTATQKAASATTDGTAKSSRAETLFHDVSEADWFVMGAPKAPVVYMFADPRCPHCKDFLHDLKASIDGGKIQVRLIPVGLLAPDSVALAAGLLAARGDAAKRLYKFMDGDDAAIEVSAKNAQISRVNANNDLMMKWKFEGTPMTVYRGRDGKVKLLQGRADTVDTLLKDLP